MFHHPITAAASWTRDRRVRRLLNSLRTRPAPVVTIPPWDRVDARDTTYAGFRVACLSKLRASILDAQFLAAEAAGDTALVKSILAQPTVEQAVDRIEARSLTTVWVSADRRSIAA